MLFVALMIVPYAAEVDKKEEIKREIENINFDSAIVDKG